MNQFTLSQLKDIAYQLSLLAHTFQTNPFYLRAKQIRQADKALILADAFFTSKLYEDAKQWRNAKNGFTVLNKNLQIIEQKEKEIKDLNEKIDDFKNTTKAWFDLDETQRHKIIQNANRANHFIINQNDSHERHILVRYKRFCTLKDLVPYSENSNYLCEAIFHYENREKYEKSIVKLEDKILNANSRRKTVNRGLWIAVFFCLFIATIPLCLPFAINLWKRKREIVNQITNNEETLRRENKRLIAADEGSVIAQEVREVLGNVSLELIRNVLVEIKDLRSEFLGPERTSTQAALLLNFMDTNREKLDDIFGTSPSEPLQFFYWLCENVSTFQNTEKHILELEEIKHKIFQQKKQIMKGYSKEMLVNSLENLNNVLSSTINFPFDTEAKSFFADLCIDIYQILPQIREALFYISRNLSVDLNYWNILKMKIQSYANTLHLCVLDTEIIIEPQHDDIQIERVKVMAV